jgi:nickel/cobalt transporter (NiCoT) family protein
MSRFDRTDWLHILGMAGFIVLLTAVGWFVMLALVVPGGYSVGTQGAFGAGLGLTAYLLGMRHAFDADHIAAIDNTTRKLVGDGQRARGVGFWFSLGHSSVVFVLCLFLALGVRTVTSALDDDGSAVREVLGVAGIVIIIGRVLRAVSRPWHMLPVGFIFGLGFDTATEVTLLVLAGGAAAFALPWYAILVLPVLFAAGMSLFDTADGVFMSAAYGWAFLKPVRKVFCNLTVTALSVIVALVIGGIELLQLVADEVGATTGPLAAIAGLDLEQVGYVIVGLFVVTWLAALGIWRFGRIEERWTAGA